MLRCKLRIKRVKNNVDDRRETLDHKLYKNTTESFIPMYRRRHRAVVQIIHYDLRVVIESFATK